MISKGLGPTTGSAVVQFFARVPHRRLWPRPSLASRVRARADKLVGMPGPQPRARKSAKRPAVGVRTRTPTSRPSLRSTPSARTWARSRRASRSRSGRSSPSRSRRCSSRPTARRCCSTAARGSGGRSPKPTSRRRDALVFSDTLRVEIPRVLHSRHKSCPLGLSQYLLTGRIDYPRWRLPQSSNRFEDCRYVA